MSSPLAGVAAINAITFGVYGNVLRRMEDPASVASVMTAGAAAGLIQVSEVYICSRDVLYKMIKERSSHSNQSISNKFWCPDFGSQAGSFLKTYKNVLIF